MMWRCENCYSARLEAAGGFEPPNNGFADRRLTTWLSRLFQNKNYNMKLTNSSIESERENKNT